MNNWSIKHLDNDFEVLYEVASEEEKKEETTVIIIEL